MSHPCCICSENAMGRYEGKSYCLSHRPFAGPAVTAIKLDTARKFIRSGTGLKRSAQMAGVFAADLDLTLWNNFGRG